jgi:twinkle protein
MINGKKRVERGSCLAKLPHKSCGSASGLQVFEKSDGSVDGYCFHCNTFVADPYGDKMLAKDIPQPKGKRPKQSQEEIQEEIDAITKLRAVDLSDRRLRGTDLDKFDIKIGTSTKDGKTPILHFYPYRNKGIIVKYKVRVIETKKMWSIGSNEDLDLFGWDEAVASGARRLIITEGELDAVAMVKILEVHTKDQYKEHIPAVCSLINGAGSAGRDLSRLARKINKFFKEVSFSFDDDDAGHKAVIAGMKVFPNATSIELPCKDANACVMKGKTKGAYQAAKWQASKPKNTRLVWGRDIHDAAKKPAEWGLSFPFPTLTEKTRGLRFGETYYFAAGEKMGKSEMVNALGAWFVKEHGLKILLAKPEEANNKSYKMILSKLTSKIFHDPKVKFDEKAYEEGGAMGGKENVCLLNLYQHVGWETLKLDITEAASQGVKLVFIDPITNLTNGMSNSDIDSHLKGVAQEAAAMAMDLDIAILFFCHLNKPVKGALAWDRGGIITTDYFAGSSAMARSCNYALGIQGNKDPEKGLVDVRTLVLLGDREFGEQASIDLFWQRSTGQFKEM